MPVRDQLITNSLLFYDLPDVSRLFDQPKLKLLLARHLIYVHHLLAK